VSDGPVIIAGDDKFRIVRTAVGEHVTYEVEKPDGADALGVERWRSVSTDSPVIRALRDYIIRGALQGDTNGV
jgi:hypothetical protein